MDAEGGYFTPSTRLQFLFILVVRGVLFFLCNLVSTILNTSTIITIYKNKALQVTSNGLIIGFSVGHSVAVATSVSSLFTDFILDNDTYEWKVTCTVSVVFLVWPPVNNMLCVMAIGIETVYSLYFPLHAYHTNSFSKMIKFSALIVVVSALLVACVTLLGIYNDNLNDTSLCIGTTAFGTAGKDVLVTVFFVSSAIGLTMSLLVVGKLIQRRKQMAESSRGVRQHNKGEVKITKMLLTGKSIYTLKLFA